MGWVVGKKRKKRYFDLIPPPNKKRSEVRESDSIIPFLPLADVPDDLDDVESLVRLEGGAHRGSNPSPDEIWGPGGLAEEAREYFAGKKAEKRGEPSGKKISKTERDKEIIDRLLDPLGHFGPIKIDDDDDDD